ncbi:MAG: hypothetical protein FWD29_00765 [Micrococcales bacterium]|nr:hypothetical protein [Micrococcales bacterium]
MSAGPKLWPPLAVGLATVATVVLIATLDASVSQPASKPEFDQRVAALNARADRDSQRWDVERQALCGFALETAGGQGWQAETTPQVLAHLDQTGGFTHRPLDSRSATAGFAVSMPGYERQARIDGLNHDQVTQLVVDFATEHRHELDDENVWVGGWKQVDDKSGQTYLVMDLTKVYFSMGEARRAAAAGVQEALYDFQTAMSVEIIENAADSRREHLDDAGPMLRLELAA